MTRLGAQNISSSFQKYSDTFLALGVSSYMNTERSNSTRSTPPTPIDDTPLPSDVLTLQAMIRELLDALKKSQHECEGVQQRLDLLLRKLYGPKAERFDPKQPWLLPEMAPENALADTEQSPIAKSPSEETCGNEEPRKRNGGRKKLPDSLVRVRTEYTLSEVERLCPYCNEVCQKFGEEISEQLDYKPASLFVRQHARFKYSCRKCHDHVTTAHVPIAIINKGLPGPGLLAYMCRAEFWSQLLPN